MQVFLLAPSFLLHLQVCVVPTTVTLTDRDEAVLFRFMEVDSCELGRTLNAVNFCVWLCRGQLGSQYRLDNPHLHPCAQLTSAFGP